MPSRMKSAILLGDFPIISHLDCCERPDCVRYTMRFNLKLYLETIKYAFFKSEGTPGKLSPKRFFINLFIFIFWPVWLLGIRTAYLIDNLFYPDHQQQEVKEPIFIVGNFRSGTTLLHRMLARDDQSTSFTSWELYLAPSVVGRKFYTWLMKVNYAIGNPARRLFSLFHKLVEREAHMHRIGLFEPEEDGQVLFQIWSSYHLLAFFPFPKLIQKYIYYDDEVPDDVKERDMAYYQEILKKHIYAHNGKRYLSKDPGNSPKVRTLHQQFPDAKFINLVRNPLQAIPSSISLFSYHCRTYGDPEKEYNLQDTVIEQGKHWYSYPHQYLKNLPPDQYIRIQYRDLVKDPKGTVEKIYQQFNLELSPSFQKILQAEAEKAKAFKSKHRYNLKQMGLSKRQIQNEFKDYLPPA